MEREKMGLGNRAEEGDERFWAWGKMGRTQVDVHGVYCNECQSFRNYSWLMQRTPPRLASFFTVLYYEKPFCKFYNTNCTIILAALS